MGQGQSRSQDDEFFVESGVRVRLPAQLYQTPVCFWEVQRAIPWATHCAYVTQITQGLLEQLEGKPRRRAAGAAAAGATSTPLRLAAAGLAVYRAVAASPSIL
jgi:hypothetical protein